MSTPDTHTGDTTMTALTATIETQVTYTYDAAWHEDGQVTLNLTTARTSKGDHTHIANVEPGPWGLKTLCGLDASGRTYHKVWAVSKARITCEKCNGTKVKNAQQAAFWSKLAAMFA